MKKRGLGKNLPKPLIGRPGLAGPDQFAFVDWRAVLNLRFFAIVGAPEMRHQAHFAGTTK